MKKLALPALIGVLALAAAAHAGQNFRAGVTPPPAYGAALSGTLGQTGLSGSNGAFVPLGSFGGVDDAGMSGGQPNLMGDRYAGIGNAGLQTASLAYLNPKDYYVIGENGEWEYVYEYKSATDVGQITNAHTVLYFPDQAETPKTDNPVKEPEKYYTQAPSFASVFPGAGNFNLRTGTFTMPNEKGVFTIRDGRHIYDMGGNLVFTFTGKGTGIPSFKPQ